jgi:hypothetical protein
VGERQIEDLGEPGAQHARMEAVRRAKPNIDPSGSILVGPAERHQLMVAGILRMRKRCRLKA